MRRSGADPLAGVERVLVDGSNLAFALARGGVGRRPAGGDPRPADGGPRPADGGPRPNAAVIATVRAAFPPSVRVELVFDGAGDVGLGRAGTLARAASNLYVEHSGRRSADRVIEDAVAGQLEADGPASTWAVLVVTDDGELRGLVQSKGARVAGTAWLVGRLARVGSGAGGAGAGGAGGRSGTGIGHRRAPRPPRFPR